MSRDERERSMSDRDLGTLGKGTRRLLSGGSLEVGVALG